MRTLWCSSEGQLSCSSQERPALATEPRSERRGGTAIIDCDVWAQKATFSLLGRYLPSGLRDWLRIGEQLPTGERIELPESQYFVAGPALKRAAEGSDPRGELRAYLDRHSIRRAIFNPGAATSVAGLANPLLAAEVARAANEWTVDYWLSADRRLLGSIVVALGDPDRAAAEIRRLGAHERMVQVLFAYPPRLLGDRWFHPIYEAACELGLPVALQAGGDYSGANHGLTAVGNPTSLFEAFVAWEYGAQPHLVSMIANGAFERFPQLRVVFNGFGIAWLPSLLWRLDLEYRSGRVPVPAGIKRVPSEYVREHVRFTTAQLELAGDGRDLADLLSLIDGERLLMFASGQLRGAEATDLTLLAQLPDRWQERLHATAVEVYPAASHALST
jgi:predicted TIM-barrel fold metal-dependent hydrolase